MSKSPKRTRWYDNLQPIYFGMEEGKTNALAVVHSNLNIQGMQIICVVVVEILVNKVK